jgi:hypothetical protein
MASNWTEDLAITLFGLTHNWLAITHFVYIEWLFFFLEEFFWPWAEALLTDYLEELGILYEVLKAQEKGFEVVWVDENGLPVERRP